MDIQVSLYGPLAQSAGARQRVVQVPGTSPTVADLRSALAIQIPEIAPHIRQAAVGMGPDLYADDAPLLPDREISLLPPVSGG